MDILEQILESDFPIMIQSSAGSGKTYTLVAKIRNCIEKGINPRNILAVTFTQDAAREMKQRIGNESITCGTLHSVLLDIVKKNLGKPAYVIDDKQSSSIGLKICKEHKLNFDKLNKYYSEIGYFKNVYPDYYEKLEKNEIPFSKPDFALFAREYHQETFNAVSEKRRGFKYRLIDFDDMILLAGQIFREKPHILEIYQDLWEYIFIDEAQDLSPSQSNVISLLGEKHKNIFIIGDIKQNIFQSFRGSSIDYFKDFRLSYPNTNVFVLPKTYRCSLGVTMAGNRIAYDLDKSSIETVNPNIGSVKLEPVFETFMDEVDFVSKQAIKVFQNSSESVRIIFRTNAQALGFQLKMIDAGVPFSCNYKNNIFNMKDVKSAISLVRFVDDYDGLDWIEQSEIIKNLKYAVDGRTNNWHLLPYEMRKIKKDPMKHPDEYIKHMEIIANLEILRSKYRGLMPWQVIAKLSESKNDELEDVSENVSDNLSGLTEFFSKCTNYAQMAELIEKISRPRDISKDERCIILSTVHGSKGLESDNVFVCGVADGLFPLASGDQEEELRLFYVAVTRAKTNLWVTGCRTYGKKEFASNSYMGYVVNI